MSEEIRELLENILDWMIENDYECGREGGHLYGRIFILLNEQTNTK